MTVSGRSAELANSFERAVAQFLACVEGVSEEQWQTLCPNEERSVGVLTHHVAAAIAFQMEVFGKIANGQQPATLTRSQLAEINAHDAKVWADCPKEETLALLRGNAAKAAAEVRSLGKQQLRQTGMYLEELPGAWTVDQWLERLLIGHVYDHLRSIRAAVDGQQGDQAGQSHRMT